MTNITRRVEIHKQMRERLLADYPALADDAAALADTLEGESDLDKAIVALLRSADDDGMMVGGINERMGELIERKTRLENRIEAKRNLAFWAMTEAGLPKLTAPDFTASIGASRAKVIITDAALIPPDYFNEPKPPEPNKTLIGQALKDGHTVPGCVLSNGGQTLTIRKK
jgi:hypothetical protein